MLSGREKSFLAFVRLGIGHVVRSNPQTTNWKEIEILANRHGLLAVIVDGIEKLPSNVRPPQTLLLEWIGAVLQSYEYTYEQYCKAIAKLAGFYNSHGYKMMVLKGYACSLDWLKPEHRPCGDIDIWLFGKQREVDVLVAKEKRIKIDNSHHHHTSFDWNGFIVENHYDFVNVHGERSSARIEIIFKELGKDDNQTVMVDGEKVYLPSLNLHALFLLRHMMSHFAAAEINLRQVLDWAFFVKNHTQEIKWEWLFGVFKEYHMLDFFNIINAICVDDLGFKAEMFPTVQFLPELKDKVLNDILEPKFTSAEPKGFMSRMIYKYKRWQGNAWKQKMCYGESRWEMFWSGMWAKMLKPASF